MWQADDVLQNLSRFGISTTSHGHTSLLTHLRGTHDILSAWQCSRELCLAGLCHSVYGTESFSKTPATLENREFVRNLLGRDAERLAYLFGAHKKESLWKNLERDEPFSIDDRFTERAVSLTTAELSDLITLTLANWLEQRPRAGREHQFIRQDEFVLARRFLPAKAYQSFQRAYGLLSDDR